MLGVSLNTSGLVAKLLMNGNANDCSGNGNDFTIVGTPTLISDEYERANEGYTFSNNQYIKNDTNNLINLNSDYSILVRFSYSGHIGDTRQIINIRNTSNNKGIAVLESWNPTYSGKLYISSSGDSGSGSTNTNGSFLTGWNTLALSCKGDVISIYLNGLFVGTTTRYDVSNSVVRIAYWNNNPTYTDKITEVLLYQRAVTEAEYQIWRLNSQLLEA